MAISWRELTSLDKLHWLVTSFIRLSLLIAIFGAIFELNWTVMFVATLTFALTFLPALFEKRTKVYLPVGFEFAIVLFVYATLFLGEVHGYYTRFWWWDIVLHSGSAVVLGLTGFILAYLLLQGRRYAASPFLVAVFSFSFALAIGALWEIFEFALDSGLGFNMQKSGLRDTMWDLIVDGCGALVASFSGWLYVRGRKSQLFGTTVEKFVEENPKLFP